MLDKNKKYSFDELKEIYLKASAKAIEKLNKEFSEKIDKTDKRKNQPTRLTRGLREG